MDGKNIKLYRVLSDNLRFALSTIGSSHVSLSTIKYKIKWKKKKKPSKHDPNLKRSALKDEDVTIVTQQGLDFPFIFNLPFRLWNYPLGYTHH